MVVIITRPQADADAFAQALRARNIASLISPVMEICFENHQPHLEGVTALVFTSANGVRAFCQKAGEKARHLPVYAIGPATRAAAIEAGFGAVMSAGGDGVSLADLVIANTPPDAQTLLYHGSGSVHQGDLAHRLRAAGIAVRRETLYHARALARMHTDARAQLIAGGDLSVALFSPRSARLFMAQVARDHLTARLTDVRALCLSSAVADQIRGKDGPANQSGGWKSIEIAENPDASAIGDLLTPYLS